MNGSQLTPNSLQFPLFLMMFSYLTSSAMADSDMWRYNGSGNLVQPFNTAQGDTLASALGTMANGDKLVLLSTGTFVLNQFEVFNKSNITIQGGWQIAITGFQNSADRLVSPGRILGNNVAISYLAPRHRGLQKASLITPKALPLIRFG